MIKKVQMYFVECDNCHVSCFEGSDYSCTGTKEYALESALESDWIEWRGKHYCQECYSYNDEDILINPITLKPL